jgi:hypothetical protein
MVIPLAVAPKPAFAMGQTPGACSTKEYTSSIVSMSINGQSIANQSGVHLPDPTGGKQYLTYTVSLVLHITNTPFVWSTYPSPGVYGSSPSTWIDTDAYGFNSGICVQGNPGTDVAVSITVSSGYYPYESSCSPRAMGNAEYWYFTSGPLPYSTSAQVFCYYIEPPAPTTTTVNCSPSRVLVGAETACTVRVSGAVGSVAGDEVLFNTTSTSGTFLPYTNTLRHNGLCVLSSSDSCLVLYSGSVAGQATITAQYLGDSMNAPSTATTQVVIWIPYVLRLLP